MTEPDETTDPPADDTDTASDGAADSPPDLSPDVVPTVGNLLPTGLPVVPAEGPALAGPNDPVEP